VPVKSCPFDHVPQKSLAPPEQDRFRRHSWFEVWEFCAQALKASSPLLPSKLIPAEAVVQVAPCSGSSPTQDRFWEHSALEVCECALQESKAWLALEPVKLSPVDEVEQKGAVGPKHFTLAAHSALTVWAFATQEA
jgi:hypothetical protein